MPYYPQANGTIEAFNKILETMLTKSVDHGNHRYANRGALEERLAQLEELEEEQFLAGFHQQVQKQCKKAWHDHHIKVRTFKENDLVLLYDSKFKKFLGKLCMHWSGPYVVKEVIDGGAIQLAKLNGDSFPGRVNGSCLKLYMGEPIARLTIQMVVSPLQPVERERRTIK
eukprot:PITA_03387